MLHGQENNTGHGVSGIPDKIRGEIRHQLCRPEVQQEPVIHSLPEGLLKRNRGISDLSLQTFPRSFQPAYRGRTRVNPGYALP